MINTVKLSVLIVVLLTPFQTSFCQNLKIDLSPKHAEKLSTIKPGHKRLTKFYKFYKKDSVKHLIKQEKFYKKILDSTYRAKWSEEKMRRRLARKGIALPENTLSQVDSLDAQLKRWYAVMKDSTSSDSLKNEAQAKVKSLAVKRARLYPGFEHLAGKYQIGSDTIDWKTIAHQVPGLDTLSALFDSQPDELFALVEKLSVEQFQKITGSNALPLEFHEVDKIRNLPDEYQKEYEQYTDKEKLKATGKEEAVEEALDYFSKHTDKLHLSQAKVSKLLAKYKDIANSNDLSTAVKRASMQGKTFWEHLVIGGNFNVLSTDPVSIDLSPQLGYKFTTRFSIGVGMSYRQTFSDSLNNNWYVSPVNTGFKTFANYDVLKGFYVYGEWERGSIAQKGNDRPGREWRNNYFAGIGKKFLVHPKVYLNTTLLYNINNEDKNPVHRVCSLESDFS